MNLIRRFGRLLGRPKPRTVEVIAVNANGTSLVESPDGQQWTAQGDQVAAGETAIVEAGRIIVKADNAIPHFNVTV